MPNTSGIWRAPPGVLLRRSCGQRGRRGCTRAKGRAGACSSLANARCRNGRGGRATNGPRDAAVASRLCGRSRSRCPARDLSRVCPAGCRTRYCSARKGAMPERSTSRPRTAGIGQMQRRRSSVGQRVSPLSLLFVDRRERRDRNRDNPGVSPALARVVLCHSMNEGIVSSRMGGASAMACRRFVVVGAWRWKSHRARDHAARTGATIRVGRADAAHYRGDRQAHADVLLANTRAVSLLAVAPASR